jgi:hypothetical protein
VSGSQLLLLGGAQVVSDPNFEYTTLLLPGNGTNGAQNNTFLDSSTNNFTITRNGNTTQGTFSPFSQTGWGNYFDGTGDYLSISSNANLNASNGDFTVEGWVYQTVRNTNSCTFFSLRNADDSTFADPGINNDGKLQCWNSSGAFGSASTATVSLFQWTHVAFVRSSNVLYYYINGTQSGSTTMTNTWSGTTPKIGGQGWNSAFMFNGYISNFRYTKSAVYTTNFTPSTTPLAAITNTQVLTCQSNRFIDNSANAYAITRNGDVSVQAFSPFNPTAAWSAATYGGSGYFDGSGDYLSVADNAAWNMGSGDFTAECWIYPTSFANEAMIMGQWSGATGGTTLNWALMFDSGSAGYLRLITSSNGSSVLFDLSTSTFALSLNTWQHIAAVRNGNTYTIYVNGVSRATTTNASALYDATNVFTIGAESTTPSQYFQGYMSDVRVVKGTAVYTAAFTPPTAPLTAITNTQLLTNFTNAGILDATSKNNLETVGNAQISTTQSKFGGSSMYFDGTGDWLLGPASQNLALGTGNFTVEAWIYVTTFTTTTGFQAIFSNRNSTTTQASFDFGIRNSDKYLYFYNRNTDVSTFSTAGLSGVNTWIHVAIARVGSTITFYINGTASGTVSVSTNSFGSNNVIYVGSNFNATPDIFNGYIDDLRVTKGVARYTTGFTPPTAAFPLL